MKLVNEADFKITLTPGWDIAYETSYSAKTSQNAPYDHSETYTFQVYSVIYTYLSWDWVYGN